LLKNNLSKNNHTKNKAVNGINAEDDHNHLKKNFGNLLENFKFNQSIDLEVLLKEYII
jgi:hypothetical protein